MLLTLKALILIVIISIPMLSIEFLCDHLRKLEKFKGILSFLGWLIVLICVWMFLLPSWGIYPKPEIALFNG